MQNNLKLLKRLSFKHMQGNKQNVEQGFDQTFPFLENIVHFDIRENIIDKFDEIMKLQALLNLKRLFYKENSFEQKNPNYLLDTTNIMIRDCKIKYIKMEFIWKYIKQ